MYQELKRTCIAIVLLIEGWSHHRTNISISNIQTQWRAVPVAGAVMVFLRSVITASP